MQYGILFFACFMLMSKAGSFMGGLIESCIDSYYPLSYLSLNKGDERVVEEYNYEKKRSVWGMIFSALSTVALGTLSSLIANAL